MLSKKVKTITQKPDRTSVFAQYTVIIDDREKTQTILKDHNIPTAVHYPVPMHLQPAYQHLCCPECCPKAVVAADTVMSLPMHPYLDIDAQNEIVGTLIKAISS